MIIARTSFLFTYVKGLKSTPGSDYAYLKALTKRQTLILFHISFHAFIKFTFFPSDIYVLISFIFKIPSLLAFKWFNFSNMTSWQ